MTTYVTTHTLLNAREVQVTTTCLVTYDRYAREPEMTDAKRLHELFKGELRRVLAERGVCSRLEHAGSSYEGTKVRRSDTDRDLEFDVFVILRFRADQLRVYISLVVLNTVTATVFTRATLCSRKTVCQSVCLSDTRQYCI